MLEPSDPAAAALTQAIRTGDITALEQLLADRLTLAGEPIAGRDGCVRTPLHIAADWPGYFPNGPAIVTILIQAGADPSARTGGQQPETPLHWAASSDDVDVAEALLNGGADLEAPGGSIGTPLDNAVGYGCWHVARLLVQRGARVTKLWHAAALGLLPLVEELLAADPGPDDINEAFWQACHGGQRRAAELLLARGADISTSPGYASDSPAEIAAALDTRRQNLVAWLHGHSAMTDGS